MSDLAQAEGTDSVSVRTEYEWHGAGHAHNHKVLLPKLQEVLGFGAGKRLIDLGCGNGSMTAAFADRSYRTVGVDIAASGVRHAQQAHPDLEFLAHDLGEPLPRRLHQRFDVALSAEVIEHLLLPRSLFRRADEALKPGGRLVITTPYHGWLKNLALAVTNKFDGHWSPGWDYGHVKFFSRATLIEMTNECGFTVESVHRVGRIPALAMSMVLVARKQS